MRPRPGPNQPAGAPGRVAYLDGIRGVAIAGVLCTHWLVAFTPFGGGGFIGVTVFFVLSGYVITTILWRGQTGYRRFLRARVRRLYPALLGLLAGGVVLAATVPHPRTDAEGAAGQAILAAVQATAPWEIAHRWGTQDLFAVTWSLGVEWYFYVTWAAVLIVLRRRSADPVAVARVTLILAVALWAVALPLSDAWFGSLAGGAALLVGCSLALAGPRRQDRGDDAGSAFPVLLSWGGVLGLVCFATWTLVGGTLYSRNYELSVFPAMCGAAGLWIVSGVTYPSSLTARLLSWRPLAGLGRVSYSLYLWHTIPLLLLTSRSFPFHGPAVGAIELLSAVALTALSYLVLEKPFLRSRASALSPSPVLPEASVRQPSPASATRR